MPDSTPPGSRADTPGLVAAGKEIESESFRIIDAEVGRHDFPPSEWQIVRRVIHTSGDFDFAARMAIHPRAVEEGVRALRDGCRLFADTRMIEAGLAAWRLAWFGNRIEVPPSDPATRAWAEETGTTRSAAAFRKRASELEGNIVVVGNAPTALLEIVRLVEEGLRLPLVIGVPVGFVQAAESKAMLHALDRQPSIAILGSKGGSTIAVAILHALLEIARSSNREG